MVIIVTKGLIPTVKTSLVSWIAIRGESNIAESISLGIIGITGIGYTLTKSILRYEYGQVTVGILLIVLTMFSIELLTQKLKSSIRKDHK